MDHELYGVRPLSGHRCGRGHGRKSQKKRSCTIAASPAAFVLCLISFNKHPRFKQPSRSLLYLSTQLATTFMIFNDFFGGSSHLAPTNFRTRHVCAHPLLTKLDRFVDKHAKPVAHVHSHAVSDGFCPSQKRK
jgi:hypothetical protein